MQGFSSRTEDVVHVDRDDAVDVSVLAFVYVDTAVCMSWRSFLESSAGKHHALYVLNLVHVLYGVQLVKKYSRKQKAPKTNHIVHKLIQRHDAIY